MIIRTDDPLADFDRDDAEEYAFAQKCPICEICGQRITDDTFRRIGNACYHDSCIETVQLDSYVEGVRYGY